MAEFWWGDSPKNEIRQHGYYYPSCKGKCEPILQHMLQGLKVDENPLLNSIHEDEELEIVYEDEWLVVVNKPAGIVCTEDKREKKNIIRFLNYPVRVTYIGRLDKDSHGLLLMTNNGDIINKMMRAGNRHEKEYKVTVDKEITQEFLEKMASGVPILDTVTRPCKVEKIGKMWYSRQ